MKHPLHKLIGTIVVDTVPADHITVLDPACGGNQRIPLFCSEHKSRKTQYCNVDLLVLHRDKTRMIMEIEESDVKPTHVLGKFLASALSSHFIHVKQGGTPIPMVRPTAFVQVVDAAGLKKDRTSKVHQFKNLENSISRVVPLDTSPITSYDLMVWDSSEEARMIHLLRHRISHILNIPYNNA